MELITFPLIACGLGSVIAIILTATPIGQRIPSPALGWVLAIAPAAAFIALAAQLLRLFQGEVLTWRVDWLPALGLSAGLYLDGLSALFGLIVTGIGALVLIYAGYYFAPTHHHAPHDPAQPSHPKSRIESPKSQDARFFLYTLLFMTSMLGLVLAGDAITLFVFWEGTSVTSFLLIAYKTKDEEARRGAFKALFVTGGGGIALLAGLLFASAISGGADWATIFSSGAALRDSAWYPVMLGLIAFGAFTKSAQAPFHFWLPTAMSAPTPASAYLHSATMVKAGVYILARLHPALGNTDLWFWLLAVTGAVTMLTGAIIGLRQVDLKAVLAYSTISQLGVLVMLIGKEDPAAFKALAIGILAHALYKGALFMVVGVVDHATGTRDLRRLGRIWRAMPLTFAVCSVAALSMAGLPPLFGFLAKETLLAAAIEAVLPPIMRVILPAAIVLTGAFLLAQAGTLALDTFVTPAGAGFFKTVVDLPLTGEGRDDPEDVETIDRSAPAHTHADELLPAHDPPPLMLVGPAVLAALSVVITVFQPPIFVDLLSSSASAAYGAKVKVSLELFHGVNLPLILSMVAIALGSVLFWVRSPIRSVAGLPALSMNRVYTGVLVAIDRLAALATRTQAGRIRAYLTVILVALFGMVALFGNLSQVFVSPPLARLGENFISDLLDPIGFLRAFSLLLAVAAAFVSVTIRRDLLAILVLGASGFAVAM
uniref:proton-conducting transporter transmembrane domain-containing protein n=1 Tax=Candidatus Roseilinea sp. TaxID=2838777 RepID=UPI004048F159